MMKERFSVSRYITLGADKNGEVYGLELNDDGTWRRNSLGYHTSCAVIRPVTKKDYEYATEDPNSARVLWQQAVAADQTILGLNDWFDKLGPEELVDRSFVFELLSDNDNPTVGEHNLSIRKRMDECDGTDEPDDTVSSDSVWDKDYLPMLFQRRVELALVESDEVPGIESENDVYEWAASGVFPPKEPFAVEFAQKAVLEEYYAHLRETYKEFK